MTGFNSKRQASLDTLDHMQYQGRPSRPDELAKAVAAEPVAWRRYNRSIGWQYEDGVTSFASDPSAEPLYAAPQSAVAEPLTDKQMDQIMFDIGLAVTARDIARAIEAAHGIGIKGATA